ncbi:hypothetical protein K2X89_00800 [Myxococcota bacterium]|nr:hypothetical protein [Myxococcota bacterium]
MGRKLNDARRNRDEFEVRMSGLEAVLERLSTHYMFDAGGRIQVMHAAGVSPRFVLGRATEGCVWRFRADLDRALVVSLARLAGREPGARFDGDFPAPPERLDAIRDLLARAAGASAKVPLEPRRMPVLRSGRVVGELWSID